MASADKSVAAVAAIVDVIGFVGLLFFYFYNYSKGMCKWEVIFVCSAGMFFNLLSFIFDDTEPFVVYPAGADHKKVPWIRFVGWLFTCPVLLILISNLNGEESYDTMRMIRLVGCFNGMVLTGATAALSRDENWAYAFYFISWSFCCAVFLMVFKIFREALKTFPEQARGHVLAMATCFFTGWSAFGLFFACGPEGWDLFGGQWASVGVYVADMITKHLFGYIGWSLRWRVLRPLSEAGLLHHSKRGGFAKRKRKAEVLVCELDDPVYNFWASKLRRAGVHAVRVRSVKEAAAKFQKHMGRYAFLLANIEQLRRRNYKDIHGPDALEPFVIGPQDTRPCSVVTYFRNVDDETIEEMTQHAVDDYLTSPFDDQDVLYVAKEQVSAWLRKESRPVGDVELGSFVADDDRAEAIRRSIERKSSLGLDADRIQIQIQNPANSSYDRLPAVTQQFGNVGSPRSMPNRSMPNSGAQTPASTGALTPTAAAPLEAFNFSTAEHAEASERLSIIRSAIALVNESRQNQESLSREERRDLDDTMRHLNKAIREAVSSPKRRR